MMKTADSPSSPEDIERQLEKILASSTFLNAGRSSAFLVYIVSKALAGDALRIKEYTIGVEVFARNAEYDPSLDSIVRVEATRLRSRLANYYDGEGRLDAVLIDLPKGGYAPEFNHRHHQPQLDAMSHVPDAATLPVRWWRTRSAFAITCLIFIGLAALVPLLIWNVSSRLGDDKLTRIAVLPFAIYSESPEQAAAAARLTDSVTAKLVQAGTLSVVPSSSVRAYQNSGRSLQDIASELKADILVQARLLPGEKPLRVEAFMTDEIKREKLWVDSSFQGDDVELVARQIADAVIHEIKRRAQSNQGARE